MPVYAERHEVYSHHYMSGRELTARALGIASVLDRAAICARYDRLSVNGHVTRHFTCRLVVARSKIGIRERLAAPQGVVDENTHRDACVAASGGGTRLDGNAKWVRN